MLRYTTFGAKLIAWLSFILAGIALYLPFLEGFALTPAIAFIHRFSITLNIGSDTKTLQPIVFIIPILLVKALIEYQKRYSLKELLRSKLTLVVAILVGVDLISLLTSSSKTSTISGLIVHFSNIAVFVTASIWLKLVSEMLNKETLQKAGLALVKTFSILLIGFTVTNTVVSVSQFFDCSLNNNQGCHIWKAIDQNFPNKLLPVGHQKFSYKPLVIRAPGFFGDVNFNGMISLFIVLLAGILYVSLEILTKEKGYQPTKEKRLLLVPVIAGIISFALTFSRSALLGVGVMAIVFAVLVIVPLLKKFGLSAQNKKRLLLLTFGGVAIAITLFAAGFLVPLSYGTRKSSLSGEIVRYVKEMFSPTEDSAQGHASLFVEAVKIGNTSPIFGTGLNTFSEKYVELINPENETANPHSTYALLYAEQGIIGVVGYMTVIVILWIAAAKSMKSFLPRFISEFTETKRPTKEQYVRFLSHMVITVIGLGIPFFSIATITYYGFFLPMVWWWGNKALLEN